MITAFADRPAAGRVANPKESVTDTSARGDVDLKMEVMFARSGRSHSFAGQHTCLLDFAEARGIEFDSSCWSGDCGTCQVAFREGSARTADDVEMDCDDGCCLTCSPFLWDGSRGMPRGFYETMSTVLASRDAARKG